MPTSLFVKEAMYRLEAMPTSQHTPLSEFKGRLLKTIAGQFGEQPKFKLFYIRTLLELQLHLVAAG